jgi:hypothetical protein
MSEQTITINGTVYDAHTGLPIGPAKAPVEKSNVSPVHHPQIHPSQSVHHTIQKSQTLNRHIVQKKNTPAVKDQARPAIQKSPAITKFAPNPVGIKQQNTRVVSDFGPVAHPMVTKAHQQQSTQVVAQPATLAKQAPKPSQVIKQEAIKEALEKAPSHNAQEKTKKRSGKLGRFASIGSVTLALILLAGYFTYLNMPSLSVRVAAAQAGVNASYPEYHPDGYSLSGAVAYSQGQVSMKFASNKEQLGF